MDDAIDQSRLERGRFIAESMRDLHLSLSRSSGLAQLQEVLGG